MRNRRWKIAACVATGLVVLAVAYFRFPLMPFRCAQLNPGAELWREWDLEAAYTPILLSVLDHDGEVYWQVDEDTILVTPQLFFDRCLRWNYTTKSNIPLP